MAQRKEPRVTGLKQQAIKGFKVDFADEPVTAWGGMVLAERLAARLGLWKALVAELPAMKRSHYRTLDSIKAVVAGLLSGGQGTFAAEGVRRDAALLKVLGLEDAPEEVTVWRRCGVWGAEASHEALEKTQRLWVRRAMASMKRGDLLTRGFLMLFGDGSLLEGSRRREGTKTLGDKGTGLMWTTIFAGPMLAAQRLAEAGRGENADLRAMLPDVLKEVVEPLKLEKKALLMMDSLHGDGPTLEEVEKLGLKYVVGANKLAQTARVLAEQPEIAWQASGARPEMKWSESAVCGCWIQCEGWPDKRLLVGRRWKREGEFVFQFSGVMTNLTSPDVAHLSADPKALGRIVWELYDAKGGLEVHYKEMLEDLGLHHPPCQELSRNRGFYAVASLAGVLGRAVDLLGGRDAERGSAQTKQGGARKRPRPKTMRLWRLRRELLAKPARIRTHARQVHVTVLGLDPGGRERFEKFWSGVSRC
jgi:hypothetical protein